MGQRGRNMLRRKYKFIFIPGRATTSPQEVLAPEPHCSDGNVDGGDHQHRRPTSVKRHKTVRLLGWQGPVNGSSGTLALDGCGVGEMDAMPAALRRERYRRAWAWSTSNSSPDPRSSHRSSHLRAPATAPSLLVQAPRGSSVWREGEVPAPCPRARAASDVGETEASCWEGGCRARRRRAPARSPRTTAAPRWIREGGPRAAQRRGASRVRGGGVEA